ncbi:hypothetical protein NQ318_019880 [Aromia moschata]|uniref:Uncharacterized protein n=1 Tax=Aromia moschata TaxID=1265417 RepID=A0AAV8YJK3_9CUCU|nr:hypothetical protein NQ318_019880 [Aromia moschata]
MYTKQLGAASPVTDLIQYPTRMYSSALRLLCLCATLRCYAFAANILFAYDLPSPSHHIWNYALAEGLMAKGHNVTMLGPFTDRGKRSDKYHPLVTEGILEAFGRNDQLVLENFAVVGPLKFMKLFVDYGLVACNHSYHTEGLKTLLDYPKEFKFDLIILDVTVSACFCPLIQRFGYPPTIGATAFLLPPYLSAPFGNHLHPSYLPIYFSNYGDNMNFLQRVVNYLFTYTDVILRWNYETQEVEKIARRSLGEGMDSMSSLMSRMTLLLCNLDPALTYPQPLPPNIIPVGGLHVKDSKKLPADLATIMDNATNGVVLFALGTNIRSDNLDVRVRKALLDAFAKLKFTVLWKFESELENVPKNVIIRKWLPQNDILGHPNTKLFIGHGGALSTFEVIYHAVPFLAMPFSFDQKITVDDLVKRKLVIKLDPRSLTSHNFLQSINEVLNNPTYSNNIRDVSRRMRDQPESPLDRAVFYAEYAMRHNGAQFFKPQVERYVVFGVVICRCCALSAIPRWRRRLSSHYRGQKNQYMHKT